MQLMKSLGHFGQRMSHMKILVFKTLSIRLDQEGVSTHVPNEPIFHQLS